MSAIISDHYGWDRDTVASSCSADEISIGRQRKG